MGPWRKKESFADLKQAMAVEWIKTEKLSGSRLLTRRKSTYQLGKTDTLE